jgi:hypothetical protein
VNKWLDRNVKIKPQSAQAIDDKIMEIFTQKCEDSDIILSDEDKLRLWIDSTAAANILVFDGRTAFDSINAQ